MSKVVTDYVLFENNKQLPCFDSSVGVRRCWAIKYEDEFLKKFLGEIVNKIDDKWEGSLDLFGGEVIEICQAIKAGNFNERMGGFENGRAKATFSAFFSFKQTRL